MGRKRFIEEREPDNSGISMIELIILIIIMGCFAAVIMAMVISVSSSQEQEEAVEIAAAEGFSIARDAVENEENPYDAVSAAGENYEGVSLMLMSAGEDEQSFDDETCVRAEWEENPGTHALSGSHCANIVGNSVEEKEAPESDEVSTVVQEREPAEPAPEPEPAEPINWNPLIIGIGSLLGILALGGGGLFLRSFISKRNQERQEKESLEAAVESRWDAVEKRHTKVLLDYSEYETDIWKALLYPAMHDPTIDETSDFLKVLRKADSMKRDNTALVDKKVSNNNHILKEYEDVIGELQQAFETAREVAEKLKYSTLEKEERKDIKTAVNLLKHAENSANSKESRHTYYEQLSKVVDRLNKKSRNNVIPTHTLNLIEDRTRLMITDGTSDEAEQELQEEVIKDGRKNGLLNNIAKAVKKERVR